ncbi:MAG: type II toxin-antitoxin system Phd/YefM family antitoxin [bacterium]
MERRLSIQQAREQFSTLVQAAFYRGDRAIIERHGKPMAAIIPIHAYARWKKHREQSLRESLKRRRRP